MNRLFAIVAVLMAFAFSVADAKAQDSNAESVQVSVQDSVIIDTVAEKTIVPADVTAVEAVSVEDESIMEKMTRFCLENLNYGTITLFMAIESSFIPFPSEAVVPPAAWKATVSGEMNIFLVILFATLGAIIGALFNYYLALWLGRPVIYKFANSRLGHMCLLDEAKVKKAEAYFDKHGAVSTFFGRLVPAVRQLISIPAGLARMGIAKFILFTSIGAGLWNIILAILGYCMSKSEHLKTEEDVMNAVKKYSNEIGIVFIILMVLIIGYLLYKGLAKPKNKE